MIRVQHDFEDIPAGKVEVEHVVTNFVEKVEAIGLRAPADGDLHREVGRIHVLPLAADGVHQVGAIERVGGRDPRPVPPVGIDGRDRIVRELEDLKGHALGVVSVERRGREGEQNAEKTSAAHRNLLGVQGLGRGFGFGPADALVA